tara:strand:+ start:1250 stop:1648 length:399 start_codon:yes stop_codon:yes gene_type:complete
MFKFFKKGRELNDLAKSFNGLNNMLQELLPQIEMNPSRYQYEENLLTLAYISVVGIDDKMEKYEISMMTKLIVPTIDRGFITVAYAYQHTVGSVLSASEFLGMSEEVNEVMEKGALFHEIEKSLPQAIKNNI